MATDCRSRSKGTPWFVPAEIMRMASGQANQWTEKPWLRPPHCSEPPIVAYTYPIEDGKIQHISKDIERRGAP